MKIKIWMLAAIRPLVITMVFCGACLFTTCLAQLLESVGDDLFMLGERGTVVLNDGGTVIFTPSATGNSRFQMPGDDAWRSAMLEIIRNVNKIH